MPSIRVWGVVVCWTRTKTSNNPPSTSLGIYCTIVMDLCEYGCVYRLLACLCSLVSLAWCLLGQLYQNITEGLFFQYPYDTLTS